jgi:hypothetical protein
MTLASSLHKNKMTRAMSSAFGHFAKSAPGLLSDLLQYR